MQWILLFSLGLKKQSEQVEWQSAREKKRYLNENQEPYSQFVIIILVLLRSIWPETFSKRNEIFTLKLKFSKLA